MGKRAEGVVLAVCRMHLTEAEIEHWGADNIGSCDWTQQKSEYQGSVVWFDYCNSVHTHTARVAEIQPDIVVSLVRRNYVYHHIAVRRSLADRQRLGTGRPPDYREYGQARCVE